DALWHGLDVGHFWNSINTFRRIAESVVFDLGLSWHRLDRAVRGSIVFAAYPPAGIALDCGRRTRIHLRSFVLYCKTAPIRSLHLASRWCRGHSVPLLGRPLVRRLARKNHAAAKSTR